MKSPPCHLTAGVAHEAFMRLRGRWPKAGVICVAQDKAELSHQGTHLGPKGSSGEKFGTKPE